MISSKLPYTRRASNASATACGRLTNDNDNNNNNNNNNNKFFLQLDAVRAGSALGGQLLHWHSLGSETSMHQDCMTRGKKQQLPDLQPGIVGPLTTIQPAS